MGGTNPEAVLCTERTCPSWPRITAFTTSNLTETTFIEAGRNGEPGIPGTSVSLMQGGKERYRSDLIQGPDNPPQEFPGVSVISYHLHYPGANNARSRRLPTRARFRSVAPLLKRKLSAANAGFSFPIPPAICRAAFSQHACLPQGCCSPLRSSLEAWEQHGSRALCMCWVHGAWRRSALLLSGPGILRKRAEPAPAPAKHPKHRPARVWAGELVLMKQVCVRYMYTMK